MIPRRKGTRKIVVAALGTDGWCGGWHRSHTYIYIHRYVYVCLSDFHNSPSMLNNLLEADDQTKLYIRTLPAMCLLQLMAASCECAHRRTYFLVGTWFDWVYRVVLLLIMLAGCVVGCIPAIDYCVLAFRNSWRSIQYLTIRCWLRAIRKVSAADVSLFGLVLEERGGGEYA